MQMSDNIVLLEKNQTEEIDWKYFGKITLGTTHLKTTRVASLIVYDRKWLCTLWEESIMLSTSFEY